MAGNALQVIDALDLSRVWGGVDKQTSAAQAAIAKVTSAMQDIAWSVAPKDNGMLSMLLSMMPPTRRRGPGPTPAPALPPTSTLTR
jgi:hypothetical protein